MRVQFRAVRAMLSLICLVSAAKIGVAQVQPDFFGMHVNKLWSMPIEVPIGSMRLWDTATNWFQLCPSSDYSQCDWLRLDDWLAAAKKNAVSEVVYTFGKTPDWASSDPRGNCGGARPGICYPPRDVTADGGGSDEAFRQFVEAIVRHNQALDSRTHARIRFWGIWNEPTARLFWRGSTAQLVRMTRDAAEIIKRADPQALILTPEPAANSRNNATDAAVAFLDDFLKRGGGKYADVIAFHVYANAVGDHPVPEDLVRIVQRIKRELGKHPEVAGKPLWITECSWGRSEEANWRGDDASAFLMRFCVLAAAEGIQRIYWYGWDVPTGTLWADGHALGAAHAFAEVQAWIVGRSVTNCTSRSHVWSCDVSAPNYVGRIVWREQYGEKASFDASGFSTYKVTAGERAAISPKEPMLQVGNSPVLLEKTSTMNQ